MESIPSAAVPQRFYANWDTIRENNFSSARSLSMVLTRITFYKHMEIGNSIVVSVRLANNKRTLRSNDINCSIEPGVKIDLDISFVIQYAHFYKRKQNIMEILIQRRKKYKNRQIPGFKTLCAGFLNLDEVFQHSGLREVKIFGKTDENNDAYIASLTITHCKSVALQQTVKSMKPQSKDVNVRDYSDDDEDIVVDESSSDSEADYLDMDQTPRMSNSVSRKRRSRKKTSQKNIIKQRLAKLLKRFKEPEENASNAQGDSSSSILKPTAKELEEIFQELENISDSGPEIDVDKLSIRSNPRPGLHRPFFGSKTDILPVIDDTAHSEESESEESSDLEQTNFEESCENKKKLSASTSVETTHQVNNVGSTQRVEKIKHSLTARSLNIPSLEIKSVENPPSITELLSRLDSDNLNPVATDVWICSSADFPWLSRIDFKQLTKAKILDCPSPSDIRAVLQSIISRIQKFCNTNSVSPPTTLIGVYGTDRHMSQMLRAYVDLLQNKPAPEWITHLRFVVLCTPNSAVGRLLSQNSDTSQIEASWRSLAKTANAFESGEATSADLEDFEDVLNHTMNAAANLAENRLLNLPIGEVMLQLNDSNVSGPTHTTNTSVHVHDSNDRSQIFVPFLSEIHLGNLDALNHLYFMKNSLDEPAQQPSQSTGSTTPGVNSNASPLNVQSAQQSSSTQHGSTTSPPSSPQLPKTPEPNRELHLEYWTHLSLQNQSSSHSQNDFYSFDSGTSGLIPSGKSSSAPTGSKFSIKATLKTLSIAREMSSNLLSIQFVKEKRKDKVLQKLQIKSKPKSSENFIHSRVVANVSRLICSGGKNSDIDLSIDGVIWSKIRFFQVTSQWQTHVKLFPISIPSPPLSSNR